jgi:predicted nucleic acid-binding protein
MIFADSCLVIDYLKGNRSVTTLFETLGKGNVYVNSIVVMELYRGALNKSELLKIKKDLCGFSRLEITQSVLDVATKIIDLYGLSHKAMIPDSIIAATCMTYDIPLYTSNTKDFIYIPGLILFKQELQPATV